MFTSDNFYTSDNMSTSDNTFSSVKVDQEAFSLLTNLTVFPHIVLDILTYLDIKTVKSVRLTCRDLASLVNTAMKNRMTRKVWREKMMRNWFYKPDVQPVKFQCEDDVADVVVSKGLVIASLYNGDVEVWDTLSWERRVRVRD